MDYRKFLQKRQVCWPHLGGPFAEGPAGDRLRLAEALAPGWYRFELAGREARQLGPADPADIEAALGALPVARGHLCEGRLANDQAELQRVHLLPEDEPPRFSPCKARRGPGGRLIFESLEFEGDAEEAVRRASEDGAPLPAAQKGVPASLRAAYAYALLRAVGRALQIPASPLEVIGRLGEVVQRGRPAAEEVLRALEAEREAARRQVPPPAPVAPAAEVAPPPAERLQQLLRERERPARPARPARGAALEDRVERALHSAGAEPLGLRRLAGGQVEVTYRFQRQRFITLVDGDSLRVLDAGVCLAGADQMVTLDSLPAVLREAIDTHRLVITRRSAHHEEDYE